MQPGRPLGWEITVAVDRLEVLRGVLIRLKSFFESISNPDVIEIRKT